MKDLEKINKPIIFISISIMFSSLFYLIINSNFWLAVFAASLFFLAVYIFTNIKFTIVIIIFFIIGIGFNSLYYNLEIDENYNGEVRVVKGGSGYYIGEIKGRYVYLNNIYDKYDSQSKLSIKGEFTKNINIEKGFLGTINCKEYSLKENDFLSSLSNIRIKVFKDLKDNIGARKAGLVSSLAFGYTDYLDTEDEKDMRNLGVIHAISVSGLHVALIFSLLNKFKIKTLSFIGTFLYVLLVGAMFSALRAFIMIFLLQISFGCKKNYNSIGAISASAMIITLYKPYSIFNLGFQLSFAAVIGISLFSKEINNKLYKINSKVRESIAITISASIFTMPIIIYAFEEISIISIIGNLLIVPLLNMLIYMGNALIIFMKVPVIFDFISFVIIKIIYILDYFIEYICKINTSLIINKEYTIVYIVIIMSYYFIKKGYKKFYALPIISIIVIAISFYSPFIKINYLREGAILITYKGDRKIITNKNNIDTKKLKKSKGVDEILRDVEEFEIDKGIVIQKEKSNYILNSYNKKYLLKLNKKKEEKEGYDIIDFGEGSINGFYIINKKVIIY